jgi:hypothetical protein
LGHIQALFEAVDNDPPDRVKPYDVPKIINSLKLKKACGTDGIPNECLRHLPRKPIVHLTHIFNHCLRLSHFPSSWKEANVITFPQPGKDLKFPISLLPTAEKLFEKVILRIIQKTH